MITQTAEATSNPNMLSLVAQNKRAAAILHRVCVFLTLSAWVFGLIAVSLWWIVDLLLLPRPIALLGVAAKLILLALPLSIPPPAPVRRFLKFSLVAAGEYFPVKVVWDGGKEDFGKGPFVIGYEPHSVLPQGIVMFSQYATEALPEGLCNTRILASSAGFWAPIMRHMWWWWGVRPVSRHCFQQLLRKGRSVVFCPGGVKECLYMEHGKEVAYLRKRHGFVRLALQAGAPMVPVFAFGQTDLYSYCRLFYDWPKNLIPRASWASFVRRIGYVPMLVWGWCGSFMPKQVPMSIVVGKPIPVPKIEQPTPEQVDDYLQQFIAAMEQLFEKHKAAAGYPDAVLTIY